MLRKAEGHKLDWDVVKTALSLELPEVEAEKQLHIMVSWGRYGEILAYDDEEGVITLEPAALQNRSSSAGS